MICLALIPPTPGCEPSWLPDGATGDRLRGAAGLLVKVPTMGDPRFVTSPPSHPTDKEVEAIRVTCQGHIVQKCQNGE